MATWDIFVACGRELREDEREGNATRLGGAFLLGILDCGGRIGGRAGNGNDEVEERGAGENGGWPSRTGRRVKRKWAEGSPGFYMYARAFARLDAIDIFDSAWSVSVSYFAS